MARSVSGRALLAGCGVVALAVGLLAVAPATQVLVVERVDTGQQLLAVPVENGTAVGLAYTHSVERSPVYDGYRVRGDRLELTRMTFESYGWGLPARANVTNRNGTLVYDPPGSLRELTVSTGRIAGHRLHVGDRTFDLVARADARSVRIHLDHRSPLDWLT
jgi:hypothetical protein